jgi:UDP-N-acetylglucosamine 2-epimerase (non-hydrolysing)
VRVLTIVGTRPEVIRLSRIIPRLDRASEHVLVHTGQNYDHALNGLLFEELGVRAPDVQLGVKAATFGAQVGQLLARGEQLLAERRPDRVLVLGDTNSGLVAYVAKRLGIPVVHLEAGNRCHDDRVPEEVNRRVIDQCSDLLLPYTEGSRRNLEAEGVPARRIHVVGNPIHEVLQHHRERIAASGIHDRLGLRPGAYALATAHRQENVDDPARLGSLVTALERVAAELSLPVIVSTHPRTRARLDARGGLAPSGVRFVEPVGLFDFVRLEQGARCVLTDSGTVQEECCLLRVPNVTLRDTTERPETLACGSNLLVGVEPDAVLRGVRLALDRPTTWSVPPEYLVEDVSGAVVGLSLGRLP